VLPPGVQDLLDDLTPRQRRRLDQGDLPTNPDELRQELEQIAPSAPPVDNQTTGQLLDYLLGP
jgi:hypothetical protein